MPKSREEVRESDRLRHARRRLDPRSGDKLREYERLRSARRRLDPENRAYHAAYQKQWALTHRELLVKYSRAWQIRNPEKLREARQSYYSRNRDRLIARRIAHNRADPERHRAMAAKYRQRYRPEGDYTHKEWKEKVVLFGGLCAYCGEDRPLGPDHKIPISRGGSNYIANIIPSCWPCNARKHSQTAYEFLGIKRTPA